MPSLAYPKRILDSKFQNNKSYYLILWKTGDATWEPEENIEHRKDLL